MYARVIVDVPARETNRPFDYAVPPEWRDWIEVGSRVSVPFGPRVVQGFVVALPDRPEADPAKLRPILGVLDAEPPLTGELVRLAAWMADRYVCHELTALTAMLPAALKAKYEKWISAAAALESAAAAGLSPAEEQILRAVKQRGSVREEDLLQAFPGEAGTIRRLLRQGLLVLSQTVRNRMNLKTVLAARPLARPEELERICAGLSPQARKQREILQHFIAHPDPVPVAELVRRLGAAASSVRALADKGWIALEEMEIMRDPYAGRSFGPTAPLRLTEGQSRVFEPIRRQIESSGFGVFLLQGVTGSGKTEIYLQAIQSCLDQGREAIVLVPEISLTPQMVERFKGRFGDRVAVLHSRLSEGERFDEWRRIASGRADVAVGARSAVFAPFKRLGLIIIDEEHESSYKQEDSPKYHARDVAIERARHHRAAVILGSATPSLESRREAEEGRIRLLRLDERIGGRPLPAVHIVDMREELRAGNRSMFSRRLHAAIGERLARREQMVLFLNRRGFSTFVMCRSCGYAVLCPHCDISLTYHRHTRSMRCHYCGYAEREVAECPRCQSPHIRYFGTGTQRVEEELARTFPGIRVIRMDVDTTGEKGAHEKWLSMFQRHEADVLLGTQMVAKGLDFPLVTLVGVIAADTMLHLPDFRAAERTFQLLTQVAGRAGRHELPGEVIVQTYSPEHYSIELASRHDYEGFAERELVMRREREYPPYRRLILITLSHEQVPALLQWGERLAQELRRLLDAERERSGARGGFEVLGPVASPISRLKDRYRFQCMVKYSEDLAAVRCVKEAAGVLGDAVRSHGLAVSIDVDPQMLM
jgi:primosomal protein N' (replication factor Y)